MFSADEWSVFLDDAERLVSSMEEQLLVLEQDPTDSDALKTVCRDLHTLKGSAGMIGLVSLSQVAHAAEDMVDARQQRQQVNASMVDALFTALDGIRGVLGPTGDGPAPDHEAIVAPLIERLRSDVGPSSEPAGRTMTVAAVAESSARVLERLLDSPDEAFPSWLESALAPLERAAVGIGSPEYVGSLQQVRNALSRGRSPVLRMLWHLAHRKVVALAEAGIVLFSESPAPPAREDPALCVLFCDAMGTLFGPLYAIAHAPDDPGHDAGALDDARALCEGMELAELAAPLAALGARWQQHNGAGSRDTVGPFEEFSLGLVDLQHTAHSQTGQALEPHRDLGHLLQRLSALTVEPASAAASPPAPRTQRKPTPTPRGTPKKFLRLEVDKVVNVMGLAGEIGLAIGSVFSLPAFQDVDDEDVRIAIDRVEGLIRELQDTSATLGLVPVASVFGRMKRLARDLRHQTGRDFTLVTDGEDTEIDKLLVDALNDPLVHLIRNAAGHGIEPPDDRRSAGKPAAGQIRLSARRQGNGVIVTVADDGRGLSREAILRKAINNGLVDEAQAAGMTDQQVWNLVFESGLSTAREVSEVSGRGVGMDVVKTSIQTLGGSVSIHSRPGQGTATRLHLPLTLAFLDSMVVRVGGCTFAVPVTSVSRVFQVEAGGVVRVESEGVDLIRVGPQLVPALCLEDFFSQEPVSPVYEGRLAVVVRTGRGRLAFPIDELLGHEQVTMKPLTGFLKGIRASAGCGLLRNGGVAIALNCEQLHEFHNADAA